MTSASELTDHSGYWMRMVSNTVSQAFARKVSGEGVTVAEWSFMRALHDLEPTPPSVLASLADKNDAEFFGVLTKEEHEALDRILRVLAERRELNATPVD